MPASRLTPSDIANMARLYEEEGESLSQIGERYGVTLQTVRNQLGKLGVEIRPRGGISYNPEMPAKAVRMYKEGEIIPDIADTLGVAKSTVWEWLNAAGIPMVRGERHPGGGRRR